MKCSQGQAFSEVLFHLQLLAPPLSGGNTTLTCLHHNTSNFVVFSLCQVLYNTFAIVLCSLLDNTGCIALLSSQYLVIFEKDLIFQTRNHPQVLGFRTWIFHLGCSLSFHLLQMKITLSGAGEMDQLPSLSNQVR